jgi:long-chain acyl-CoA synthetase
MSWPSGAPPLRFIERLYRNAEAAPDKAALINGGVTLSYANVALLAHAVAERLLADGVSPGDRVVIEIDPFNFMSVITYLGILWRGAVAVPVDAGQDDGHLARLAKVVDAHIVLTSAAMQKLQERPDLPPDAAIPTPQPAAIDDLSEILFSSGTMGKPKGVMLSNANIAAAIANINGMLGNGREDTEIVTVPLSHSFGLGRLRCNLAAGGTLVIAPGLRFPGAVLDLLEQHRATGLSAVPPGLRLLFGDDLMELEAYREQLRFVELGSMPMSKEDKELLLRRLPETRIVMHYGLTEASRSAFLDFRRDRDHLESVGLPAPGVSISIRGEGEAYQPRGTKGEIAVAGPTVMSGYWRDPERTARQTTVDGALRTGDMGFLDTEGYLHFAGRRDNIINVGGLKTSAEIIERIAERHPAVREAGCVGRADERLGQVPVLYVVLEDGDVPHDLADFIAAQAGAFARPRHVMAVDMLPRTQSGKLQRRLLVDHRRSQPASNEMPQAAIELKTGISSD